MRQVACAVLFALLGNLAVADARVTEAKVSAFMSVYEQMLATEDFAQVAPLIHPGATFRFTEGDFTGLAAIKGAFEKTWALDVEAEKFFLTNTTVVYVDTTSATVIFNWNWQGNSAEHGPFHVVGRGTSQLVRVDGELKILIEHLSR